jgi:hypothetical protein
MDLGEVAYTQSGVGYVLIFFLVCTLFLSACVDPLEVGVSFAYPCS